MLLRTRWMKLSTSASPPRIARLAVFWVKVAAASVQVALTA
jgi:hypothetical protein